MSKPKKRKTFSFQEKQEFCEELIAYFPFTVICVFDATSRKKTYICMHNEVNKTL
jgi:hypothetical protein